MENIFIIGSKGIPAKYGGFETFVENLTMRCTNDDIKYHVACMGEENGEFTYNNVRCFKVKVREIGAARAVLYDIDALRRSVKYIKENNIKNAKIYILACRIGPFIGYYKKQLKKLNIKLYVNPDGHEWKRAKWNCLIKKYWKISERLMVKHSDLLVCDSLEIERYIKDDYGKYNPNTIFIPYGADFTECELEDNSEKLVSWYNKFNIKAKEYYLVVGRFVPENNYEVILTEFMKSHTNKDLVIITNVEKNKFFNSLKSKTNFEVDKRIKFVGTVYDQELLKKIRENAYCYLHGHEVGGTNPSLLEALATTSLNMLLDVKFNKEVGQDGAIYFSKQQDSLSSLIDKEIEAKEIEELSIKAKKRIKDSYSWNKIISEYENLFTSK